MCSSLETCHTGCLICTSDENTFRQCNTLQHNATHTGCLICTCHDTATITRSLFCTSRQDASSARLSFLNAPQHTSTQRNTPTHYSTLQHTATHATGCLIFADLFPILGGLCVENHRNTLQYTATHCNTLQYSSTHSHAAKHSNTCCFLCKDEDASSLHVSFRKRATGYYPGCNSLQQAITYCNTHCNTHCNTLSRTNTPVNINQVSCCKCARPVLSGSFAQRDVHYQISDGVHCSILWSSAVCCGALQKALSFCRALSRMGHDTESRGSGIVCSVLQCVAVCCSVLQKMFSFGWALLHMRHDSVLQKAPLFC